MLNIIEQQRVNKLLEIYNEIDKLEKVKLSVVYTFKESLKMILKII